ncbi:MAG TPA: hypothetical protein VFX59_27975 [Polyangiales bacterium]|nr:hypothetical protein [Polyangiales bacterium]
MAKKMMLAMGLLLGCGGTETGNPFDEPGENTSGNCEVASSTKLELATPSELGFSANDVLAYAGGTHSEALTWQTLRFGSYGPESGLQTLRLGVVPRGAKLVRYANRGGIEIAQGCGAQLEIEADVTVQSSGGALNESVRTALVARQAGAATLHLRFDPAKLKGTLTVTPPSFGEGWITASVELGTQFTPYGLSGSVYPTFEQHTKDSVGSGAGSGPLATFGLPPCTYGVPLPLTAGGAPAILARLAQHRSATVGDQPATLVFEPGQVACQSETDTSTLLPDPGLVVPGTLVVKTADGVIDGRWPVQAVGKTNASGELISDVAVQLADQAPGAGSLAERYGLTALDTSGYDSSSLTVMLSLTDSWSGSVVVYGFVNPDCPAPTPGSNSSPGCPGAERSELARFNVR